MLFKEIRHSFVSVYYLLVRSSNPYRPFAPGPAIIRLPFFLLQSLLVHLRDQSVDVVRHTFKLVPQLLVLIFEVRLFLAVIGETVNEILIVFHFCQFVLRIHEGFFDELVRVSVLDFAECESCPSRGVSVD